MKSSNIASAMTEGEAPVPAKQPSHTGATAVRALLFSCHAMHHQFERETTSLGSLNIVANEPHLVRNSVQYILVGGEVGLARPSFLV